LANQIARVLHSAADPALAAAVIAELHAELDAVAMAELGTFTGRAIQAVHLDREQALPGQVAAADAILADDPNCGVESLRQLDPTSASVAAAHWLQAAVDVASAVSGIDPTRLMMQVEDIDIRRHATSAAVLEMMRTGLPPIAAVTRMIGDAIAIAEGRVLDVDLVQARIDESVELAELFENAAADRASSHWTVRLTTLDPRRPARDMLEQLTFGIQGCLLIYRKFAERRSITSCEDDLAAGFAVAVRERATSDRHRLGRETSRMPGGADHRSTTDRHAP
jgi:hypothetical protein